MEILNYFKIRKLKKRKVFLRSKVKFEKTVFEGSNKIGRNSDVAGSSIGFATYIGDDCYLRQCKIGKYCSIGSWVKVVSGKHPIHYLMTHPIVFNDSLKKLGVSSENIVPFSGAMEYVEDEFYIIIGNDVWIGQSAEIMSGIRIGDGAIIAAGAVVVKDVPPYSIVGGVPAKVIKYRFTEEEIKKLLELKLWNKDLEWLKDNAGKLSDIKNLETFF